MIFLKKQLRQEKFAQRRKLTKKSIIEQSELIIDQILAVCYQQNNKISFYQASNGEIDPKFAMDFLAEKNEISLPVISKSSKILDFRIFQIGDQLFQNKIYPSLLEPKKNKKLTVPDIVFVPLVACDKNKNRVGMGGGFYDATIGFYRKNYPKTKFIGLAYVFQVIDGLIEMEDCDEVLDFIISPKS